MPTKIDENQIQDNSQENKKRKQKRKKKNNTEKMSNSLNTKHVRKKNCLNSIIEFDKQLNRAHICNGKILDTKQTERSKIERAKMAEKEGKNERGRE